jgi:hypothetical protein
MVTGSPAGATLLATVAADYSPFRMYMNGGQRNVEAMDGLNGLGSALGS